MKTKLVQFLIKNFWWLMLAGLLIRLILAGISAWNNDIHVWYEFAADLKSGIGVYTNKTFSYPPGIAAILFVVYLPLILFSGPDQWGRYSEIIDKLSAKSQLFHPIINSPFFGYYTKAPMFLAEILLLYVLYLTYKKYISEDKMRLLGLAFYLNPLIIFINAVHAQLDIYVVLFVAVAVLLLKKKHYALSGFVLGAATTMKLYPGFLFFAYLCFVFLQTKNKRENIRNSLAFSLSFLVPVIVMLAYMIYEPASAVSTFTRVDTIGFEGSLNLAFVNYIPALVPFLSDHSAMLATLMQYVLMTVPFLGFLLMFQTRKIPFKFFPFRLELVSLIVLFLVYLLNSRTNPNYLVWSVPFLLALSAHGVISTKQIMSISLAALLFYLGIHSMAYMSFFLPLTYFGYPVESIANQYIRLSSAPGFLNLKLYADIFLLSAIWFIATEFSIIYKAIQFSMINYYFGRRESRKHQ